MFFTLKQITSLSRKKKIFLLCFLGLLVLLVYFTFFNTLSTGPLAEQKNMLALEKAKKEYKIADFVTDGCSGNVSKSWKIGIQNFTKLFPEQAKKYKEVADIPFEGACKVHDRAYYQGVGGYEGRLRADNALRYDILQYAFENIDEIKKRTGLVTDESVLFMYEVVTDSVYRGVRLGGMPCTGMSYAWGYGYNQGSCTQP